MLATPHDFFIVGVGGALGGPVFGHAPMDEDTRVANSLIARFAMKLGFSKLKLLAIGIRVRACGGGDIGIWIQHEGDELGFLFHAPCRYQGRKLYHGRFEVVFEDIHTVFRINDEASKLNHVADIA